MSTPENHFYVVGGTVPRDAPSYIARIADRELLDALRQGHFCYVLTSRQMGKSSLMVRAAASLREEGVAVVSLDLTGVGQNLTAEQWYDSLLNLLARALDLEGELEEFWLGSERFGPMQRWMLALREVVLKSVQGRIVVFVDEIDAVRSLPFSADEFFAAIRQCYNLRAEDKEYSRLTFCLLGVATPSDLIRDVHMTPFNIGRCIELRDFSDEEAAPLALGLRGAPGNNKSGAGRAQLLRRILHWTNGHPYLTQRLCRAVQELPEEQPQTAGIVDRLSADIFLIREAGETDDNLAFVRNRLLKSDADLASVLDFYGKVRAGRRVPDDQTNPLCSILKLSGVAKESGGVLKVRNPLYERVFNREWIREHMPHAELIRQQAAFRRGVLRTAAISVALFTLIGLLALSAVRNARVARQSAVDLRQNLYAADVSLAQQALGEDNIARARSLLAAYIPGKGEEDLRTFEWRHLWGLVHDQSRWTIQLPRNVVSECARYSPDGTIIAVACSDKQVRLNDASTVRELPPLTLFTAAVLTVAFSSDGKTLAARESGNRITLWDLASRRKKDTITDTSSTDREVSLSFSPDGALLESAADSVHLWDLASRRLRTNQYYGGGFGAFSPDGKMLVAKGIQGVGIYELNSPRSRMVGEERVINARFSPDSKRAAVGMEDGTTEILDLASGRAVAVPMGHRAWVYSIIYSRDGRKLASSCVDGTVRVWDSTTGQEAQVLRGHLGQIKSIDFSPDGNTLVSTCTDSTVKLWDASPRSLDETLPGFTATLSPDGRIVATTERTKWTAQRVGNPVVTLWDAKSLRKIGAIKRDNTRLVPLGFSADNSILYLMMRTWPQGERVKFSNEVDRIVKWDIGSQSEKSGFSASKRLQPTLLFISPDRTLLAVGSWSVDDPLRLFDLVGWRELGPLVGQRGVFSSDSNWFAVSRWDGINQVYDTRTWRPVSPALKNHTATYGPLAFSPDRRLLVTSSPGQINVWNTANWTLNRTIAAHSAGFQTIVFSSDGRTMATSGATPGVNLWNTATWRLTQTLKSDQVEMLQFTPNGDTLMAAWPAPRVRFWRADSLVELDKQIKRDRRAK